jgi:hypothetical protein
MGDGCSAAHDAAGDCFVAVQPADPLQGSKGGQQQPQHAAVCDPEAPPQPVALTLVSRADAYALESKPASVAGGVLTVLAVLAVGLPQRCSTCAVLCV